MIPIFIFSKNRACQLRLLLESLKKNCGDIFDVTILYNCAITSDISYEDMWEKGYEKLIEEEILTGIKWVKEDKDKFVSIFSVNEISHATQVMFEFLEENENKKVGFFVDDNVWFRKANLDENILNSLFKEDTWCVSYRLGLNTTIQNYKTGEEQFIKLVDATTMEDPIKTSIFGISIGYTHAPEDNFYIRWPTDSKTPRSSNYLFLFSVDGAFYRAGDLLNIFDTIEKPKHKKLRRDFSKSGPTSPPHSLSLAHKIESFVNTALANNINIIKGTKFCSPEQSCVIGTNYNRVVDAFQPTKSHYNPTDITDKYFPLGGVSERRGNMSHQPFCRDIKDLNDLYLNNSVIDIDSMDFSDVKSSHGEIPFGIKSL